MPRRRPPVFPDLNLLPPMPSMPEPAALPDLVATREVRGRAALTPAPNWSTPSPRPSRPPTRKPSFAPISTARAPPLEPRAPSSPWRAWAVSVKDLFIAGQPTPAGSVVLTHSPAATAHAPAVARLLAAGGALIGRTNMTEFAFSGVGVNLHHGTPANVADARTRGCRAVRRRAPRSGRHRRGLRRPGLATPAARSASPPP